MRSGVSQEWTWATTRGASNLTSDDVDGYQAGNKRISKETSAPTRKYYYLDATV